MAVDVWWCSTKPPGGNTLSKQSNTLTTSLSSLNHCYCKTAALAPDSRCSLTTILSIHPSIYGLHPFILRGIKYRTTPLDRTCTVHTLIRTCAGR